MAATVVFPLYSCNETGTGSTTESGVVSGRILTAGKLPVAGALVSLLPVDHVPSPKLKKNAADPTAVTDANGNYRIQNVSAGLYNLSAGKDTLALFRSSLAVPEAGIHAGEDTVRRVGTLMGRVELEAGDDARTVLILCIGTNTLVVPDDTSGTFSLKGLAQGEYRVRFLSTISKYLPLDTVLKIHAGQIEIAAKPFRLISTGIKTVMGLQAVWDSSAQMVNLKWLPGDSSKIAGYNIYRTATGSPFPSTPRNVTLITVNNYQDGGFTIDSGYSYAVKAVDKNGNVGQTFSIPASIVAGAAYTLVRTVRPQGYTRDPTPLAVSNGEIYWLLSNRVDVYDSSGTPRSSFPLHGLSASLEGVSLRVIGDTVYVMQVPANNIRPSKSSRCFLMKYSKQGDFLDSLILDNVFQSIGPGSVDFWVDGKGTLIANNSATLYSIAPNGKRDSISSPLVPEVQSLYSKLTPTGNKLLIMGGIRNMTLGINRCQFALLNADLTVAKLDSTTFFLNAYSGDDKGNIWVVQDDSLVIGMTPDQKVNEHISLPILDYRDIQVDGDDIYVYEASGNVIQIYRQKGK